MSGVLRRLGAASLVAVWLVGCTSARARPNANAGSGRSMIYAAQLAGMENLDAYEAIRRLKPVWLNRRGTGTFEQGGEEAVQVYVDNVLLGGALNLRRVSVADVSSIEYLDARQATTRFGIDHGFGAILVRTRQ